MSPRTLSPKKSSPYNSNRKILVALPPDSPDSVPKDQLPKPPPPTRPPPVSELEFRQAADHLEQKLSAGRKPKIHYFKKVIDQTIGSPPQVPPLDEALAESLLKRSPSRTDSPSLASPRASPALEEDSSRGRERAKQREVSEDVPASSPRRLRKEIRGALQKCDDIHALNSTLAAIREGSKASSTEGVELAQALRRLGKAKADSPAWRKLITQVLHQEADSHRFALAASKGTVEGKLSRHERAHLKGQEEQQRAYKMIEERQRIHRMKVSENTNRRLQRGKEPKEDVSLQDTDLVKGSARERSMELDKNLRAAFRKVQQGGRLQKGKDVTRALRLANFQVLDLEFIEDLYQTTTILSSLSQEDFLQIGVAYAGMQSEVHRKAFARHDVDGSGEISTEEVLKVLEELGSDLHPSLINEIFAKVDFDTSGGLNFDEYLHLLQLLQNSSGFTTLERDDLRLIFRRHDYESEGAIVAEGLASALSWLGFRIGISEVKSVLQEVDKDGNQMMQWEEFVMAVAMVRDREVQKARQILEEFDEDGNGALAMDELERAMRTLEDGVVRRPLIQEVVREICDHPRYFNARRSADFRADLRIEDIPDFLALWRMREGLLKHELDELENAFRHYDFEHKFNIRAGDVHKVLRWFGYRFSSEEACMALVKVADVDRTGSINFKDLRWIMRMEHEESVKAYTAAFRSKDRGTGAISTQEVEELGILLGLEREDGTKGDERKFIDGLSYILKKDVDLDYFVKQCLKKKKANLTVMRQTCGLTPKEHAYFEKLFMEYATEDPNIGYTVDAQQFKFAVTSLFRGPVSDVLREPLGELLKDHHRDPIQNSNLKDFLKKMEPFKKFQDIDRKLKEQAAIKESHYNAKEVAEFRELFKASLPNSSDLLDNAALRSLVGAVFPLSEQRNASAFLSAIQEVQKRRGESKVQAADAARKRSENVPKQKSLVEEDAAKSTSGSVDFGEFLLVMRKLESLSPSSGHHGHQGKEKTIAKK